jgi:transcriptional regulator with XRE-family HTH domain
MTRNARGTIMDNPDLIRAALPLLPKSGRKAAEMLGISEATVRRWRSGDVGRDLTDETRAKLLRLLGRRDSLSAVELLELRRQLTRALAIVDRVVGKPSVERVQIQTQRDEQRARDDEQSADQRTQGAHARSR